ncbi:hypothetical protein ASD89_17635 [Caulobacter sp. Root656]|nr:hypothetical protein ASD89_17635 [Caulobacter sp. Root656]
MKQIPPYRELGTLIAQQRIEQKMPTQADLAGRLGIKQQSVSRWEAGTHRPGVDQLPALAKVLDEDLNRLRRLAGYDDLPVSPILEPFPIDRLDPVTFEAFVAYLAKALYPDDVVRRLGASGHKQDGGDVVVTGPGGHILIQCKRVETFGPADVRRAVEAAAGFEAREKVLALSRTASPAAAAAVEAAGWVLWDKDFVSREIRHLAPEHQERLVDIFFRGQRQALLGRPEPGPWRTVEEFFRPFEDRDKVPSHSWTLLGRQDDVDRILALLESAQTGLTLLSAAGGMGKSRLLREIAERAAAAAPRASVRFLLGTEDVNRAQLEALGAGAKLLIVDDAHDRDGLGALLAYAADPDNKTRLLLAARPYAIQRIRREAAVHGLACQEHALSPLTHAQLLELAGAVLANFGAPSHWAEMIVEAADRSPLIVAMGARIVARDAVPLELAKNQPAMRDYVLGKFTKVLAGDLGDGREEAYRRVLDVLALVQPFHPDDPQLLGLIEILAGVEPQEAARAVRALIEGGVAYPRAGQYRLMPDVLADYLIESRCLDGKRLSAFAQQALTETPPSLLTNLMVNLGRLDWRRSAGDTTRSTLLEAAWRRLENVEYYWDDRVEAAKAVAMFQPRQALDYVSRMARAGKALSALPDILRNVALVEDFFEDAAELLWELARVDDRETSPFPSHPVRVLSDMGEYHPRKPVVFSQRALALGLRLAHDETQWDGRYTPFEILRPLMALEGTTHRSDGRAIHMSSFFVDYAVVAPLRAAIIDLILELIVHPNLKIAHLAAAELEHVLRYPRGALGAVSPEGLSTVVEGEFVQVLKRLRDIVPRVAPTTTVTISRTVRWMARHGRNGAAEAAREVLAAFPSGPDYELLIALAAGHAMDAEDEFGPTFREAASRFIDKVASWLEGDVSEPKARLQKIEAVLDEIIAAALPNALEHVLPARLMERDPAFAEVLVVDALARPSSATARFAGQGLWRLLKDGPEVAAMAYLTQAVEGPLDLQLAAAQALGGRGDPTPAEVALLRRLLASSEPVVVSAATRALWSLRSDDPLLALDLVLAANLGEDRRVLDDMMMALCGEPPAVGMIDAERTQALLDKLEPIPRLEGYWVNKVLAELSYRFPFETAEFLRRRVERAAAAEERGFRPANHGPYSHDVLRFIETDAGPEIFSRMWAWLRANQALRGRFFYAAGTVFEAMFLLDDTFAARAFDAQIAEMTLDEMELAAGILANASPDFIFGQADFVVRFMNRVQMLDPTKVEPLARTLSASSRTGVRGGLVGVPTAEDVSERDRSLEMLARLPRLSPARPVYEDALSHAQWGIERTLRDAEALDQS